MSAGIASGKSTLRRRLLVRFVLAAAMVLLAIPAVTAGSPVTYVIDTNHILDQFSMGQYCNFVRIGNTTQIIMDDPLIIIGSGADSYEINSIEKTLMYNYFRPEYILNDSAREFAGRNLTDYNLVLIGGPEHNAYTKYLIDNGYLTYDKTDKKMPAVILEVAPLSPGNRALVVGDSSGYPYSEGLPLSGIIPDQYAPAAAVATGVGLGFFALFFSKIFSWIGSYLQQSWQLITGMASDYLNSQAGEMLSDQESKRRHIELNKHRLKLSSKAILLSLTSYELVSIVLGSLMLATAFIVADQMDFSLGTLAIYFFVAGFATLSHEIGHRLIAYRYKIKAEFQFWGVGTIIMLLTSWLFGTVFSGPARTLIGGDEANENEMAFVLLTGPAVSVAFSLLFLPLVLLGGIFATIGELGFSMNLLSGIFSLMPFAPMDGKGILSWSKVWWCVAFVPLLIFYLTVTILFL